MKMLRTPSSISSLTTVCYSALPQQAPALYSSPQNFSWPANSTESYHNSSSNLTADNAPHNLILPKNPFAFEHEGFQVVYSISGTDPFPSAIARQFTWQAFITREEDRLAEGWQLTHELPGNGIQLIGDLGESRLWWYMNQRGVPEPKEKLDYNMLEIALYGTIQLVAAYGDEMCRAYRFHLFDLRVETVLLASGELKRYLGECDGLVMHGS